MISLQIKLLISILVLGAGLGQLDMTCNMRFGHKLQMTIALAGFIPENWSPVVMKPSSKHCS